MPRDTNHTNALLRAGLAGIRADTPEQAVGVVAEFAGETLEPRLFREAIAGCLRDGLIREPLRLEEGGLHCHWRLELTPLGAARARALAHH